MKNFFELYRENVLYSQNLKENKKFQYAVIQKGARASLFGESIDWLINAGLVLK